MAVLDVVFDMMMTVDGTTSSTRPASEDDQTHALAATATAAAITMATEDRLLQRAERVLAARFPPPACILETPEGADHSSNSSGESCDSGVSVAVGAVLRAIAKATAVRLWGACGERSVRRQCGGAVGWGGGVGAAGLGL
jgi:hypothetical protein